MAGDWIKMRLELQTHPKIVRILSATKSDKFRVIGGLHAVWGVFDTHSADGRLDGYSPDALDHVIGWPGFSSAMIAAGWLIDEAGISLLLPDFSEHNGTSGKRRAEDQKRKRNDRKGQQSVRNLSTNEPDEKLTREEKRREELTPTATAAPVIVDLPNGDDPAVTLAVMLRRNGVNATSVHPDIQAWATQGVKTSIIEEALTIAKERKGSTGISPGYLRPIIDELLNPPTARPHCSPAHAGRPEKFDPTAYVNRNRKQ